MPTPPPLLRSLCAILACMMGEMAIGADVSTTSGGLRFQASRAAADQRDAAEQALQQQNLGDAGRVIERLRAEPLIPTETGAISGTMAVRQLLRHASGEHLAVLQRLAEQQAQHAWERWQQQPNLEQLQDFCQQHGDTATGRAGWLTLAVWLRDEGRWQLAATAWQQVLQHPHSPEPLQVQARQGLEEAARYGALRLPSNPSNSAPGTRLTATPRWSKPHAFPPVLSAPWEHWRRELRLYGAVTWPSAQPLADDPRSVIVRTPTGIVAYDPQTGSEAWRTATEDWGWIERTPGQLENPTYRQPFLDQFGRQLVADSVWGRLSGDRQRIYAIQSSWQLLDLNSPAGPWASPLSGDVANEPFNFLTAYDRQTGLPVWKVGGNAAGPTYPLANQFFCGGPLVVDDLLYVVGQQRSELQLLALNAARGELLWKLTLGDVPRSLSADPARQRMACTPRFHQGLILCPTGTGALIAVDPLTRSLVWAQRYGVAPREALARPRGDNSTYLPDVWWDSWRAVELVVNGDHGCLASPESNALHGFRLSDGTRVWSQPQQRGLDLLGSVPQGILVQEANAVRLHDWLTGAVLWRTLTGEAAGRGCVSGTQVLLPTSNGSVTAIDLETGKSTADDFPLRQLGDLHTTGSGWVSVRFEGLDFWTDATEAWAQLQQQPAATTPESSAELEQQAKIALAAGQATAALDRLPVPSADIAVLRRLTAQAGLRQAPQDWERWLALIHPPDSPIPSATEVASLLPTLSVALQQTHPAAGIHQTLEFLNGVPRQGEVAFSNPQRLVRPDLALVAPLLDWSREHPQHQQVLRELLQTRWSTALASNDPFAIQKLTELWQPLPDAHLRLLSSGEAPFLGQSLLAVELRLLAAAESPDPQIATQAQTRLIQLLNTSGFPVEADEYARQFAARQPAPHVLPSSASPESPNAWASRKPAIERTTERNHHVYYFPVPFDQDSSPFFDRLDMTIERQGNRIRFGGGGHAGTWEVPLPKSTTSPFRYLQQHAFAWGRGRVVVLRVGFELFGLAPINDAGEPAAHVLWHLDTLGGTSLSPERLRLEVLPAIPGVREEEYRILDPFGGIVAQVGPVRSEYLCYTDKRQLICIDLLTGMRRWSRWDLPQGTILGGDDEFITLWQPEARRLEWLRASDGQTAGERSCDLQPDQVLRQSGRLAWVLQRDPVPRLECLDLITGTVQWSEPRTPGSVAFVLDPAHLGTVTPSGDFRILHALTGRELARHTISDVPAVIDRVVIARDAQQWYVALSERVARQAGLQAAQLRSGYRAPFITGPLVALSRQTGHVAWQTPLVQEPFACDQPKSAPVLLQVYKQPPADLQSGQLTDGVLKIIDKATGAALLDQRGPELIGYAAMSTDPGNSVVNLALERETLRLRYRPRPPEPATPDWD